MNLGKNSREADKFVVRLPEGMRDEVANAANEIDTSMNTVFIQAVREKLDRQQKQKLLLEALAVAAESNCSTIEKLRVQLLEANAERDRALKLLKEGD